MALGGHGNGRKWPIVFAGIMLDDEKMRSPTRARPGLLFSEDMQTMFDDCWTGAKVVYAGHMGPKGHPRKRGWGRYEHLPPGKWEFRAEAWRRANVSSAWVGQALAAHIMHAEKHWDHDAYFAYVDRWMYEDDTEHIKAIREAKGWDFSSAWARQGANWDPCVQTMWKTYRAAPGMPDTDIWQRGPQTR